MEIRNVALCVFIGYHLGGFTKLSDCAEKGFLHLREMPTKIAIPYVFF